MTPTSLSPLPAAPRAGRAPIGRLLTATLAAATLSFAVVTGAAPVGAVTAEVPAADPVAPATTMPGKGHTEADEVVLSGDVGGPASRSTPPGTDGSSPDATADAPARPGRGEPGWSQVIDLLPGTQMVALSWDGDTSGPDGPASGRVSLRSRAGDGAWTDWLATAPDPADAGGEGGGRVGSEVVWLGSDGADRVEVRVDAGPLADLELLRMRYQEGEPVPEPEGPAPATRSASGTTPAAPPTIRPRSAWATSGWASGNSGCGSEPSVASRLDHAVIHHTASTNSYTAAEVPGVIDGIRRYHMSSLGWCDIAYNFVVDKFGGIWQGRSGDITKPVVGGHARGFNTYSVGVTLLGQFEPGASPAAAAPTAAMIDSTARLLAWKLGLHSIDPQSTVTVTSAGSNRYPSGTSVTLPVINTHNQTGLTACPGANVLSQMEAMRMKATAYSEPDSPTPPPPPPPPPVASWTPFDSVEALVYRQYVDFLRQPGTYDERRWWAERLSAGTTHRNALIVSMLNSGRVQADSASSVRLYLAYFGRIPDHTGLRHWWAEMDRGQGIRTVSAAFARSHEFTNRYGSLSDAEYVTLVYRNVLGREPDVKGYAFWTEQLRSRRESRGGLMVLFSESGEHRSQRDDVVDVVLTHEMMLDRGIGTISMLEWVARIQSNQTALIDRLFTSSEYAARVG
ncbi:DUF4214 domain-containing protein [Iamia sp.]|uniref:DUF4214 domain-containing protein n=1 Tax=Iamia sp. TaxID=2722710 RepID=UPI002B776B1A|nr:DUF4214 domain-containing protein [Iamia sp.]HXH56896.1 DUF4214 domain-containing protein [Iamia sp.]